MTAMKFNAYGKDVERRRVYAPESIDKHLVVFIIDQNGYGKWYLNNEHVGSGVSTVHREFDTPAEAVEYMYHLADTYEWAIVAA